MPLVIRNLTAKVIETGRKAQVIEAGQKKSTYERRGEEGGQALQPKRACDRSKPSPNHSMNEDVNLLRCWSMDLAENFLIE